MTTEELEYTNQTLHGMKNDASKYLWVAFLVFVVISSLIGDTIILIATVKYKAIKLNKIIIVIIQHIAVSDLMVVLTYVLPKIVSIIADGWVFGSFLCKMMPYGKFLFFSTGMFLVGAMTTSKMFQLKNPLRFGRITVKTVHCFCLACWIGATVFLTFIILMTCEENSIFSFRGYECYFTNSAPRLSFLRPIIAILSMFGPACVVVATTIYILVTAMKSAKRVRSNLKWQGTMATLLTAIFYILSSSPKVIYRILEYIHSSEYESNTNMFKHFYKVAESCLLFNTISNFYIYCLTITSFRKFIFTTICRCHRTVGNVPSFHEHGK